MSDHTIVIIFVVKIFFVQFFCVFLPPFLISSASVRSIPFSTLAYAKCHIPGGSDDKEIARKTGDPGLILGSVNSPGERNSNQLQYSFLEDPMDRGAWQAIVPGLAKSQIQLSD